MLRRTKPLACFLFGKTFRERLGTVLCCLLVVVIILLARQVKLLLRSPAPAAWNHYSQEANDHLYSSSDIISPRPMSLIAHAGGTVPKMDNAGTLQRLDHNYLRGHRLFELDLNWTVDEELVVIHDWGEYDGPTSLGDEAPTLAEFLAHAPDRHASLRDVYAWLEDHPEAFIVTDCKERSLEGLDRIRMERPGLVPRFIIQIYHFKDFEPARSRGFRHIILTLYRCLGDATESSVVQFAREHELFAVTVPEATGLHADLPRKLNEAGIVVYAHTINDAETVAALRARGVWGVYTDTLRVDEVPELANQ